MTGQPVPDTWHTRAVPILLHLATCEGKHAVDYHEFADATESTVPEVIAELERLRDGGWIGGTILCTYCGTGWIDNPWLTEKAARLVGLWPKDPDTKPGK